MSQKTKQIDDSIKSTTNEPRNRFTALFFLLSAFVFGLTFYFAGDFSENPVQYLPIAILMLGWYIGRPIISGIVHKRHFAIPNLESFPSVTVQMPAYNESQGITEAIESVVRQDYPGEVEIVVVDDGSTDDTWNVLQSLAEQYDQLRVLTKENEGIAPTRNLALEEGIGEIVVSMDSDTILEQGAILSMVGQFTDGVVGVASNVEIKNDEDSWWTRAQSIEYLISMEMSRNFQSKFRHLMVVSGGCGAYKREVIEEVGGWNEQGHRYAEDFDLTIQAHRYGDIAFTPDAIALTEGPNTLRGWWEQRVIWAGRGLRTVLHHWRVLFQSELQSPWVVRNAVQTRSDCRSHVECTNGSG